VAGAFALGRSSAPHGAGATSSTSTTITAPVIKTTTSSTTSTTLATSTSTTTTTSTTSSPPLPTVTLAADGGSQPTWTGMKPSMIGFSGDATNIVTGITWTLWGSDEAVGHGTWGYDSCDPDCASGAVTDYEAIITLSNPVGRQFTALTEQTEGPHGFERSFALPAPAGGAPWIELAGG
jgi:hypothetical protein